MLVPTPGGNTVSCEYCGKVYPSRKSYTDHRRNAHGIFYVSHSSVFTICSIPSIAFKLILVSDKTFALELKRCGRNVRVMCHLCSTCSLKAYDAIKAHYWNAHQLTVSVGMRSPTEAPNSHRALTNGVPLPTPSPSVQNAQRERDRDSEMVEGNHPQANRRRRGSYDEDVFSEDDFEPKTSEENPHEAIDPLGAEHDGDQSAEDEGDGGLWDDDESLDSADEYEEEMVVPESFTLQCFAPPLEDDPSADEGQGEGFPRAPEDGDPSYPNVYGSKSKCPDC